MAHSWPRAFTGVAQSLANPHEVLYELKILQQARISLSSKDLSSLIPRFCWLYGLILPTMADQHETSTPETFTIDSYETALCVIPPAHDCERIEQLRALYDKAYGRWPPHVNLIYPFVSPELLPQARDRIQAKLAENPQYEDLKVSLDKAGTFTQRSNYTVFVQQQESGGSPFALLRSAVLEALGRKSTSHNFHLTIGQTEDKSETSRGFLLGKARLLPRVSFRIGLLAILARERVENQPMGQSRMRLWGIIDFAADSSLSPLSEFWLSHRPNADSSAANTDGQEGYTQLHAYSGDKKFRSGTTYRYDYAVSKWCASEKQQPVTAPAHLRISSYNVLIDSEHPPARERFPLLLKNLLSKSAVADILVLQEVSDDFLSFLLSEPQIARLSHFYTYSTHGPPNQIDLGPLPSLRNVVILSRFPFEWQLVPFSRRHKAAVVAIFQMKDSTDSAQLRNLVIAGIHLTSGLTDGSVVAKKSQLHNLKTYLAQNHPGDSWIVAGDFNLTTSSYTIETAVKNNSISEQTAATLTGIETMLKDAGLMDAWATARLTALESTHQSGDDLYDGEDGATFNPRENHLAAAISGTSNNRPQRYDRILVRSNGLLRVAHFNDFGAPGMIDGQQVVASDHSGVRAVLKVVNDLPAQETKTSDNLSRNHVDLVLTPRDRADLASLESALAAHDMIPSEEQRHAYVTAFMLLKEVIIGSTEAPTKKSSEIPMVVVPVGSYALGVWDGSSDLDCLAIGSISSKTFFQLALQRIRRAEAKGVRLIRKVDANTGTMLELSVNGINADLQYCPAASIVERWTEVPNLHHFEPIFNLSMLSLRKLKPYRDIMYVQRSLPSLSAFRLAYRCIKLWAVQRGIYSSRFGYLGGIHITLMLSWICKRLVYEHGTVSVPDILGTFFHHYANFDWNNQMVYDAFFHQNTPRYQRSAREPMVVLGYHAPNTNAAHTSTVPGLNTLTAEFALAHRRLTETGVSWADFFAPPQGDATFVSEFLKSHDSYARINIQYWGRTLARGRKLVGWVESRSLSLVVDISKALPEYGIRIWPARFTNRGLALDTGADYNGCYLVGISKPAINQDGLPREKKEAAKTAIDNVFVRFLSQLHGDEKNYDSSTSWIDLQLVRPGEVSDLVPDTRNWGEYDAQDEFDSDIEDDQDDQDEKAQATTSLPYQPHHSATSHVTTSSIESPKPKLRPASDILSRLRWDPALDPNDYIVGYEDRFLGPREIPLGKWKSDVSHDEFVPMHRVLYFKKKADGGVIWDRKARIDQVFRSGGNGDTASDVS